MSVKYFIFNLFASECRECTCKEGKISCSKEKCGNPVPTACWIHKTGYTCVLQSPCPEDAVHNGTAFCLGNPGKRFCDACNVCTCEGPGEMSCTEKGCFSPTASMGAYTPLNGVCVWQLVVSP